MNVLHARCDARMAYLEGLIEKLADPASVDHAGCRAAEAGLREQLEASREREAALQKRIDAQDELLMQMHRVGYEAHRTMVLEQNAAAEARIRLTKSTGEPDPDSERSITDQLRDGDEAPPGEEGVGF